MKYEEDDKGKCYTNCPYNYRPKNGLDTGRVKVGSMTCGECPSFISFNAKKRTLQCKREKIDKIKEMFK